MVIQCQVINPDVPQIHIPVKRMKKLYLHTHTHIKLELLLLLLLLLLKVKDHDFEVQQGGGVYMREMGKEEGKKKNDVILI